MTEPTEAVDVVTEPTEAVAPAVADGAGEGA